MIGMDSMGENLLFTGNYCLIHADASGELCEFSNTAGDDTWQFSANIAWNQRLHNFIITEKEGSVKGKVDNLRILGGSVLK